ncbi:MAG: xerDC2 [Cypionkella sp.]|uniref:tyrosine-type recombinase/integrase n=1 Tax=Cypionkella sp. TaxID=2811411 RepID=UPI002616F99B|nr:tyrosine-type recombinase/integrase [Cypionkella sp.]MDB5660490.1 xerDC2 [Cypionkella sp.]
MKLRLKPSSQANLILSLLVIAKASAPEENWAWLERGTNRLIGAQSSISLPAAKPISAQRIFRESLKRLNALDEKAAKIDVIPLRMATHFLQSLLIAFLIARPVRRRALLAMQVNQHLVQHGDGFQLCFDAADMKDKKQRAFPLPKDLVRSMQAYLDRYRPVLLCGKQSSGLWISQYGEPLTKDGLSRELPKVVQRHFSIAMRPHAFRHIAATSIAEVDPEHVNIIKDILGHATLAMSEKHYNRASGISCCNGLQSIVEDIRKNVPKIGRVNRGHRDLGTSK